MDPGALEPLALDALAEAGVNAEQAKALRANAEAETLGSSEAFRAAAQVVGVAAGKVDAKEALVGVTIGVTVAGGAGNLLVDLKNGPTATANLADMPRTDLKLEFESEEQFRGVLSRRLDMEKLIKLGQVKVGGSLSAKMKLMPLAKLGKRIAAEAQKRHNKATMDSLKWEQVAVHGSFSGMLDKKSEWLRQWNARWFTLDWDQYHRPVLSYADSKNAPPRATFELHSSCVVEPRATTRRDKSGQAAFALVDRRTGTDLLVVCASGEKERSEWLTKIKGAITARARSRQVAADTTSVGRPEDEDEEGDGETMAGLTSLGGAGTEGAPRVRKGGTKLAMQERLRALEDMLVISGAESNLGFLMRKAGWTLAPALVTAAFGVQSALSYVSQHAPPTGLERLATVAGVGLAARILMRSSFFALFRRRMKVYLLSARLIFDLKVTELRAQEMPPVHSDAVWRAKQREVSERVYCESLRLGGLWVKAAQHLGARSDFFPDTVTSVLGRLQDEVPGTPFEDLILAEEVGNKRVDEVFSSFDESPIAAASIGQVHLATLKEDESRVVVKLQHPGVDRKIRQDVHNMGVVLQWIKLVDRKLDLGPAMEHWRKSMLSELDFLNELGNMTEVGQNLQKGPPVYATVPAPVMELSSRRMMVMRFVPGVKVTDREGLRSVGVISYKDRGVLANDICEAFAHQMFIGGLFNADPHPGNVLVARREDIANGQTMHLPPVDPAEEDERVRNRAVPVLLDFGLSQRLPDHIRLGFAQMVLAGSQIDAGGLMWAGKRLGVVVSREDLLDDFAGMQHMFRDTAPPEESRKEAMEFIDSQKAKFAQKDFENPLKEFPPEFMLFFRSLNLLRGLCSSLEVRQPFIKTLAAWARRALRDRYPEGAEADLAPPPGVGALEKRLRAVMVDRRDDFVGAQVCIIDHDEVVVSIAGGEIGQGDPRPVSARTLFPAVGLGQGVAQIATRLALHETGARTCGDALLEAVLTGDLARLPAGPGSVPPGFETKTAGDWRGKLAFADGVAAAADGKAPAEGADAKAGALPFELSHAAFFWGWAAMLVAEGGPAATGEQPAIAAAASRLSEELCFGLGDEETAEAAVADGKVAELSFPVQRLLEENGMDDVGSMGTVSNVTSDQNKAGAGLAMIHEVLPGLRGKEFWIDPRMCNFPRVLAACLPASNVLCTAESLARLMHAVTHAGRVGEAQVMPEEVATGALQAATESGPEEPFQEGRVGLREFHFATEKGDRKVRAIGQLAFGGSSVLSFPELGITVSVLVSSLSLDRAFPQALFDIVYEEYGLCPEGDF